MVEPLDDVNLYTGSDFDDFLAEEDILGEASALADERLFAIQAEDITEFGLTERPQAD